MNKLLLPLAVLAALCACVTPAKFKASQDEAQSQKKRADDLDVKAAQLTKDLDAEKKKAEDLSGQVKTSAGQLASLQVKVKSDYDDIEGLKKSNADLQQSLNANKTTLSQKVADLIKDRDALQQKATAAEGQVATLNLLTTDQARKIADAEAARKALEDAKAAELAAAKKSLDDMAASLKGEIEAGQVQISQLKGKLTLNMVDQILFDSGDAAVKADGKKVLDKVGAALNQVRDKNIRIEGHTDDKPITAALQAKYASNWELSTARATSVVRYLIDHASVDAKRLVAAGYGEHRPKASNDTPDGRSLNRRIEIILVPKD